MYDTAWSQIIVRRACGGTRLATHLPCSPPHSNLPVLRSVGESANKLPKDLRAKNLFSSPSMHLFTLWNTQERYSRISWSHPLRHCMLTEAMHGGYGSVPGMSAPQRENAWLEICRRIAHMESEERGKDTEACQGHSRRELRRRYWTREQNIQNWSAALVEHASGSLCPDMFDETTLAGAGNPVTEHCRVVTSSLPRVITHRLAILLTVEVDKRLSMSHFPFLTVGRFH